MPGDNIVGFITRGYGVSIHREDCPNHVQARINPESSGRWIDVSWASQTNEFYTTTVKVMAMDRGGLVMDVATVLNALTAKVRSLSARTVPGGRAVVTLALDVHDLTELKLIIQRLTSVPGVTEVVRAG